MSKNKINVWSYLEDHQIQKKEISKLVDEVFLSGRLILGNNVKSFEDNFSNWVGVQYGIGVGNGTDAIKLALLALNIGKNDEVITVSNTAVPTVSAIVEAGADPVFCDVEEDYNISVKKIESLISKKTKAILLVHLYGHPAEVSKVKAICKKYGLFLIEDCAQAHGSKYKNKITGSFGDISAFSFYPTKILGGYGDGGMCLTSKLTLNKKLRMLRFYGMKDLYFSEIENGVNSRLDEVHAAILDYKLKYLDLDIEKRRKIAALYNHELEDYDILLPEEKENYFHSYYLYVVRHKNRTKIMKRLKEVDINCNISYPYPIHSMPPFKKFKKSTMKTTNKLSKEIFSLPMYSGLSEKNQLKVIKELKKLL